MKRKTALGLLYFGAWLAAMEIAGELLTEYILGTLPLSLLVTFRAIQTVGLLIAITGLLTLIRRPVPSAAGDGSREDLIIRADRVMRAYVQDVLQHMLYSGLILTLLAAYALVFYLYILSARPNNWFYQVAIIATLGGLATAWILPYLDLRREERALRAADTDAS